MYETIDHWVSIAALAVMAVFCVRMIRGGLVGDFPLSLERAASLHEDSVMVAVLAYLLGAMLFSGVAGAFFQNPQDVRSGLLVGNGAQIVGLIACLLIASKRFTGGARRFIFGSALGRGQLPIKTMLSLAVLALGFCPLVRDGTVVVVRSVAKGYEFPVHPTIAALGQEGVGWFAVVTLWIGASVIAPMAEEAFFRGILQTFLFNIVGSRRVAIVLASLAFGLVHFQQPQAIPALVVLGMILGYAYERSSALIVPVTIHAVFNLKTLIWFAGAA